MICDPVLTFFRYTFFCSHISFPSFTICFIKMSRDLTTDAVPSDPAVQEENVDKTNNIKEDIKEDPVKESPKNTRFKNSSKPRPSKSKSKQPNSSTINNLNINAGTVHFGSVYNYYGKTNISKAQPSRPTNNVVETEKILKLMESKVPVTEEEIRFVSKQLSSDWRYSVRALLKEESKEDPLSINADARIDQFYEKHLCRGVSEVIYQLLLDWKQDKSKLATIGKLSRALWENDQKPAVEKLAEVCL